MIDDPESGDALTAGAPSEGAPSAGAPVAGSALPAPVASGRSRKTKAWARPHTSRRLAAAGVVILAAIGFLLYKGLTSAIVYFKTANEAIAGRAQLGDSTFQLEGVVEPGTVHQLGGGVVSFVITGGSAKIPVTNNGEPPQLFRPGIAVVVVGHFVGSSDDFASDQILVKHSNQYIAAHPGRVSVPAGGAGAAASAGQ